MMKCMFCFLILLSFQNHFISSSGTIGIEKRIELLKILLVAEMEELHKMTSVPTDIEPLSEPDYEYLGRDDGPIKPVIQYKEKRKKKRRTRTTRPVTIPTAPPTTTIATTTSSTTKITPADVYHRRFSEISNNINGSSTHSTSGSNSSKPSTTKV